MTEVISLDEWRKKQPPPPPKDNKTVEERNAANEERVRREREQANASVLRCYRIKPKGK